jgi:hypothetical protein
MLATTAPFVGLTPFGDPFFADFRSLERVIRYSTLAASFANNKIWTLVFQGEAAQIFFCKSGW